MVVWLACAGLLLLAVLIIWGIVRCADDTPPSDEEGYEGY